MKNILTGILVSIAMIIIIPCIPFLIPFVNVLILISIDKEYELIWAWVLLCAYNGLILLYLLYDMGKSIRDM